MIRAVCGIGLWRAKLRRMLLRAAALLVCLAAASGQNLSVGFIGGGAVTNAFYTNVEPISHYLDTYSQKKDYLVGLTLEYHFTNNFSLEGDAIYRELHLVVAFVEPNLTLNSVSPSPVVTWELPVLAKYWFHWAGVDPFIEAGPALRPTTNLNANPSHYGVTAGIGVATHWKGFEISPMVRYNRWATDPGLGLAESKVDQIELLAGISGRPHSAWHPLSSRIALGVVAGMTLIHDVPTSASPFLAGIPAGSSGGVRVYESEAGTSYISGSYVFLMGPALEAALPKRIYLELNAVYHPIDVSERNVLADGSNLGPQESGREGNTWEFPVLARYKFRPGRLRPFAEAGPSFRLPTEHSSIAGVSAGGGVEVRMRALRIAPGVRFTHWGPQGSHGPSTDIVVNQIEFLTAFLL